MIIRDLYLKKIQSFLNKFDMSRDGIIHINIRDFLLNKSLCFH